MSEHEEALTRKKPSSEGLPEAVTVAVVPDVVSQEGEVWPVASDAPGDRETVKALVNRLEALTDVGTLAEVVRVVLAKARAERVRPEVLAALVKPYLGGA